MAGFQKSAMPFVLAILAALAPAFAKLSEGWFELVPCELCLWQRAPYWVAVPLFLAAGFLPRRRGLFLALGGLACLVSAAIGGFHAGVEWGWWPSPLPGCAAPTAQANMSLDDLMRSLAPAPTKPCDAATFLIPGLPVSMAAMNAIYGLVVAGLAFLTAKRR